MDPEKDRDSRFINAVWEHRFISSGIITLLAELINDHEQLGLDRRTILRLASEIYVIGLAPGLVRRYSKRKKKPKRNNSPNLNLEDKIIDFLRIHPLTISAATGLTATLAVKHSVPDLETLEESLRRIYELRTFSATAMTTEIVVRTITRNHEKNNSTNLYDKFWNNPLVPGLMTSAALAPLIDWSNLEDPIKQVSIGISLAIQTSLAITAASIAGDILNTHGLKDAKNRLSQLSRKNRERKLKESLDLALTPEQKVKRLTKLATYHQSAGETEKASQEYREAIRILSSRDIHNVTYSYFLGEVFKGPLYQKIRNLCRRKSTNIEDIIIDILNRDLNAINRINTTALGSLDTSTKYLYGIAKELAGEDGKELKLEAIQDAIEKGEMVHLDDESRNPCYRLKVDDFFIDEVIIKEGDPEALEAELTTRNRKAKTLENYPQFNVPTPVGIIESHYVMELERGETLHQRKEDGRCTEQDLEQAVDLLAILQANSHEEKTGQPERNYATHIQKELTRIGVSEETINRIIQNLTPALESIQTIPEVESEDFHDRNIYYTQRTYFSKHEGIVKLDTEEGKRVRATADLTELLDFGTNIEEKTKEKIVKRQGKTLGRFTDGKIDLNKYYLGYLNHRIIRPLEKFGALFNIESRKQTNQRGIANAISAIRLIQSQFPDHYQENAKTYQELTKGLTQLQDHAKT